MKKKRKRSLSDLVAMHPEMDYQQFSRYIQKETEEERLKPVIASKQNGKNPPLFNSYWEIYEEQDYKEVIEELTYQLSPLLELSYYKKNPARYQEDAREIRLLSEYLIYRRDFLKTPETINERSFEIFHREKFLDRESGRGLLGRLNIKEEMLNFYETSVPMSYYSHHKKTPQKFLIIENKDTFYSMRKYLIEGKQKVLGLEIGTLIFGGGKGIYRSFADFVNQVEPYFGAQGNQIYYFGDLDFEGIAIYLNLVRMYQEKAEIFLFVRAYQEMLKKAAWIGFDNLPFTKEGQNDRIEITAFLQQFPLEEQKQIEQILKNKTYIPQEIINVRDYKEEL